MRQQGVALISVLLVVVIATVLSVSMIRHQNLTIHKARNVYDQAQAAQYALGGEDVRAIWWGWQPTTLSSWSISLRTPWRQHSWRCWCRRW